MIADVRRLLSASPFEPFTVQTSAGKEYRIETPDHAGISPAGGRIVIWFDDDSMITVSGLHIVSVHVDSIPAD